MLLLPPACIRIFGTISDNIYGTDRSLSNLCAGGVLISSSSSFTMLGGTIRNNTCINASKSAGGVCIDSGSNFDMKGGVISGNNAIGIDDDFMDINGGGVYIARSSLADTYNSFTKTGNSIIYGNNAGDNSNIYQFGNIGHAVYWHRTLDISGQLFRNSTLGENDNISSSTHGEVSIANSYTSGIERITCVATNSST